MKARLKTQIVDAVLFNGEIPTDGVFSTLSTTRRAGDGALEVFNLQRSNYQTCRRGDWIVAKSQHDFEVMQADFFLANYEPIFDEGEL